MAHGRRPKFSFALTKEDADWKEVDPSDGDHHTTDSFTPEAEQMIKDYLAQDEANAVIMCEEDSQRVAVWRTGEYFNVSPEDWSDPGSADSHLSFEDAIQIAKEYMTH